VILLTGGTLYDGSGGAPRDASVLIEAEAVQSLGRIEPSVDMECIDGSGLASQA
jgi:hypothetical protein